MKLRLNILSLAFVCLLVSCGNNKSSNTDYLDGGDVGYFDESEGNTSEVYGYAEKEETKEEEKQEISEPDVERIKWDLQGETFLNPVSNRYLNKITIVRKEDITDLKIVSKKLDDNKDFVNYSVTLIYKGDGHAQYTADLDIAYNIREISGSKVTKGWVYYWTKVQKIDVVTTNNNYKTCLTSHLTDRTLMLTNACTNAIVIEGSVTYYDRPQNFYHTLEAGSTYSITDIKDYKIEKVFRP